MSAGTAPSSPVPLLTAISLKDFGTSNYITGVYILVTRELYVSFEYVWEEFVEKEVMLFLIVGTFLFPLGSFCNSLEDYVHNVFSSKFWNVFLGVQKKGKSLNFINGL